MKPDTTVKIFIISGAVLGILMACLMGSFNSIYNSVVDKNLKLSEGAQAMEFFTTPPVPIYMKFYLFNVTNPDEVQYYNEIPILQELGPYIYEEVREKFNKTFSSDGSTIQYRNQFKYTFNQEMSGDLKESDVLNTLNVVFVSLASLEFENENIGLLWPELERTMSIFESRNVSEILFQGWALPEFNFNFAESFNNSRLENIANITLPDWEGTLAEILVQSGLVEEKDIPDVIKQNHIGYFNLMNNTDDGKYEVDTGTRDINEYLTIRKWNDETALDYWDDPYCNMINGTDGTQFPPRSVNSAVTLRIFVTQLCRSLYLNYEKSVDFYGIKALRFRPPAEMLMSPYINPDNMCYCEVGTLDCLPSGFLEMTPCMKIPIVTSTPHFYNGDMDEVKKYVGLNPNQELHDTVLDVERTLGVPVSAHKRIQINLPLRKYGNLTSFMNFDDLLFPVLWCDEFAELSESDADTMKMALTLPFTLMYSIGGILSVVSLVLLMIGLKKRNDLKKAPFV